MTDMKEIFKKYPGYSWDFYLCLEDKIEQLGEDAAVTICEREYG